MGYYFRAHFSTVQVEKLKDVLVEILRCEMRGGQRACRAAVSEPVEL